VEVLFGDGEDGPLPSPLSDTGDGATTAFLPSTHDICDVVNSLPCFAGGPCSCSPTNGGTGLIGECTEDLPLGLGRVGVRVEIEPCEDPAYIEVKYSTPLEASWISAGRLAAGGDPLRVPLPGLSLMGAGLNADIAMTGTADDMSVHVILSLCILDSCNGNIFGLSAVGWPADGFSVLEFDDLKFVDSCPASDESDDSLYLLIAAIGGVVVIGAIGVWIKFKKGVPTILYNRAATRLTSLPPLSFL
jgi:hypothetical protein